MKSECLEDSVSYNEDDYGLCCICEGKLDIVNIVNLPFKVKSESGWGCVVCDLPMEGAVSLLCSICIEDFVIEDIKFLTYGKTGRIPLPHEYERVIHEHDMSKHIVDMQ